MPKAKQRTSSQKNLVFPEKQSVKVDVALAVDSDQLGMRNTKCNASGANAAAARSNSCKQRLEFLDREGCDRYYWCRHTCAPVGSEDELRL